MLIGVGKNGGGSSCGGTDAGFYGQGVGLSGLAFGSVGGVGDGTADGLVEVGTD